ncbi:hypothetical protein LX64_03245 [Chitinophaga skermanii]|uniref:Lipoprotein n=1 Tax=Chitinophaga skermanii TaxID=331697 RepID=A0A327QC60_9BACT|nr:hypothetical protein [Chitinophaga skermanii]RAJ02236.1 hypothetical protein LX64_03245 [Chitinophaga skermanii]
MKQGKFVMLVCILSILVGTMACRTSKSYTKTYRAGNAVPYVLPEQVETAK